MILFLKKEGSLSFTLISYTDRSSVQVLFQILLTRKTGKPSITRKMDVLNPSPPVPARKEYCNLLIWKSLGASGVSFIHFITNLDIQVEVFIWFSFRLAMVQLKRNR